VTRLAIFSTHPIQYQVPVWRRLAAEPGIEIVVHYLSDISVRGAVDPGFGVPVAWDTPLLDGYEHTFVSRATEVRTGRALQLPNAASILRAGKFDSVLVAGYAHAFEWQVLRTARQLNLATIMRGEFSDRAADSRPWPRRIARDLVLRMLYRTVDCFGYIGADALDHLRRLGVDANRLFFTPYCVDSDHFDRLAQVTSRAAARLVLGLSPTDFAVIFSGKLIERKGIDVLLNTARLMVQEGRHLRFVVIGDGPLRPVVEHAAAQLPKGTLQLAGFVNQSNLGDWFAAADTFILPSRHETWGLVVNEAMHFGVPVVVSNAVGCIRDLVDHAETGLVADSEDPQSFARALSLLMDDPAMRVRLGLAGRTRVARYSTAACVDGLMHAVDSALARRKDG
jgi:glycosyltransferase involved in cell wall biosynthesis